MKKGGPYLGPPFVVPLSCGRARSYDVSAERRSCGDFTGPSSGSFP